MAGVEFLSPEDDEPDGRPAEREPAAPHPPWRIWAVRVVVVVAAVAGLSVWVATRPSETSPAARRAATQIVTPTPTESSSAPRDPTIVTCTTGSTVPAGIALAMHRFLKGVNIDIHRGDRCVSGTIYRARTVSEAVIGTFGRFHVEVALSRRDAEFGPAFQAAPPIGLTSTLLGTVETESAGVKVRISVTGRTGTKAPMYRIQRLADFISLNTVL
jgi:hypothetical protein